MAHVFGYTFIADDKETAKLVAMDSNMERFNCVTLQGDSYRSDGILTGGANQQQPILAKVSQYLKVSDTMRDHKNELDKIQNEIQREKSKKVQKDALQQDLEANKRKLNMFKERGSEDVQAKLQMEQ